MQHLPPTPRLVEPPTEAVALAHALHDRMPDRMAKDPLLGALLRIAARYGEILAHCVDAAPDLHLDAMARFLSVPRRLPAAAHATLVITPASGAGRASLVMPAHTRVAAAPSGDDPLPVVFETLEDFVPVRAAVMRAVLADAGHRRWSELGAPFAPQGGAGSPGAASQPVAMAVHFAQATAFSLTGLQRVTVLFELEPPFAASPGLPLEWGIEGADGFLALAVESDTTAALTRSGELVLTAPAAWPAATHLGIVSRWLTGRLAAPAPAAVPSVRIRRATMAVVTARPAGLLDQVCADQRPLDVSKEFLPLGERPRYATSWQLQSHAFADEGSVARLEIEMVNPAGATDSPVEAVCPDGRPSLRWDIFTSVGFVPLAVVDGTASLTRSGAVVFTVPPGVVPMQLGVVQAPCVRATLASGRYAPSVSRPERPYEDKDDSSPPFVRRVTVSASLRRAGIAIDHVVARGALRTLAREAASPFELLVAPDVPGATLYLGLDGADVRQPRPSRMQWLALPAPSALPRVWNDAPAPAGPRWQAWAAGGWVDLPVADGSAGFTRPGLVGVEVPDMAARWPSADIDPAGSLLWLRLCWPAAAALPEGLFVNAVQARQTERLRNEILGSGNGRPHQRLAALRTPVIGEVQLEVRDEAGRCARWREVQDLAVCGPRDEVFTLDRIDGGVQFGDGARGRIPVSGPNNIRLLRYDSGGGRRGNVPALAINQLRTTIPGIAGVSNPAAALGGLDAGDAARGRVEAWAWLRHRDRAVCADDYADLARVASPDVRRAWCFSSEDPWCDAQVEVAPMAPGDVGIIVVPDGAQAQPQPTLELLGVVRAALESRRPPAARLIVMGPRYAPVHISVRLRAVRGESAHDVAMACKRAIAAHLHPVTGNGGRGWSPGRRPHRSDFHGLLGDIDGVDLVDSLQFVIGDHAPGLSIVAAGDIDVEAVT